MGASSVDVEVVSAPGLTVGTRVCFERDAVRRMGVVEAAPLLSARTGPAVAVLHDDALIARILTPTVASDRLS
jgi:hypothetical protein